jgi:protoporphyrinogen oxidase
MTLRVAIVGAGAAGLAAAYDLTRAGARVVVYEAAPQPGGLASGFRAEGWSWSLERFYHHWFASDTEILRLIRELGLSHRVRFPRPVTAVWYNERPHPFDSPLAVLRFPGLSLLEKLRMGLVIAYLRLTPRWEPLERVTAHEWLPRYMGRRAYEQIWQPLLEGKFGRRMRRSTWPGSGRGSISAAPSGHLRGRLSGFLRRPGRPGPRPGWRDPPEHPRVPPGAGGGRMAGGGRGWPGHV